MTGIRGGGVGHAKWVVRKKKEEDALKNVKVVVLVLGGNDFCERGPNGVARVVMGKAELEEWMRGMVEWMLEELPEVEIRTMDPIPRDSDGGKFVDGVRRFNSSLKCVSQGRHQHISCFRVFSVEPRSWKLKTGKGNRGSEERKEEKRGSALPRANRFDLRWELYSGDGVHLCALGRLALRNILAWQLEEEPGIIKEFDLSGEKIWKLKAFLKF